ncbi:MAG: glycosyltransferase [Bacteroidota bacterium]
MKIIQLVDSLEMGGTERMCVNIANGLSNSGIKNAVVITRRPYTLSNRLNSNTTLFTGNKKSRWDFISFRSIYQFVKKEKPEFIHSHSTTLLWACLIKILQPNIKLIWHDHFGNRKQANDNFIHVILSFCINGIIAVNDEITQWHIKHMYVKKENIICLPNFASLHPINTDLRNAHTIVMNANLLPVKDHLTLLKAMAILHQQEVPFNLYLIGKEVNTNYVSQVKSMIQELHLSNNVTMVGQVNDIEAYLGEAGIGVLTSTSEGLPMSLLEYGLAGLAVLSTDVGQCAKVLKNGELGWVVPAKQPQLLADSLLIILNNPILAREKAQKLNEHIQTHYSEKAFMRSYFLLLNNLN